MENQKKRFVPSPPSPPNTPSLPKTAGTPGTPDTPGLPATPETPIASGTGSMPADSPQMGPGPMAFDLPAMPSMPPMPHSGFKGLNMGGIMEKHMEHHKNHHLDENGECKPHLKKVGLEIMKKYME
jgi:hypothetical protein